MPKFRASRRERSGEPHAWISHALVAEPDLGDEPLRRARSHTAMGSWEHARDLLAATGKDWPLREHRISVLADQALGLRWPTAWLLAEPDSVDARVLDSRLRVRELRALLRAHDPAATDEAAGELVERLETLAEHAPADPGPWTSLLMLAPVLGEGAAGLVRWGDLSFESGPLSFDWFRQAVEREPESWAAHHAMLEGQVARLRVAAPADCLALLDYAAAAAANAPPDSPLAVLGVHAIAALDRGGGGAGGGGRGTGRTGGPGSERGATLDRSLTGRERAWLGEQVERGLDAAYDGWLHGGVRRHPQAAHDLAALALGLYREHRDAQADEAALELARTLKMC